MIKLTYLAHSSMLVECGNTSLVFDPWLKGPAYYKQWYLWPLLAVKPGDIKTDAILISHGHEDHLHIETLKVMDKKARIFFPFQWRKGIKPYLKYLGFNQVTEAVSFSTYHVNDVKVTYIGYSLESVIVIEYKGEVLVNINDALNSNHENAVEFILKELKRRWPKIDYFLSGWSGASYFPNQIRYPGKDDKEIGLLREQYFANNFFRFSQALQPKWAVPFAPGFMLLEQGNQWINHIKFPRHKADEYYKEYFSRDKACLVSTKFLIPFPGDIIMKGKLEKKSHLHSLTEKEQYEQAYMYYKNEIEEAGRIEYVEEEKIELLIKQLAKWMMVNKDLYHPTVIEDIKFSIKLNDVKPNTYLNIEWNGSDFSIIKDETPLPGRQLIIYSTAKMLLYGLSKTWGGDALTIGYGMTIEVYEQLALEKNLDIVCIRLITRYPTARKDLTKYPFRAIRFYTQNPRMTSLWLKQKINLKPYVNKYPYNERDHWLSYNKCDLCAVCKMPEINMRAYMNNE